MNIKIGGLTMWIVKKIFGSKNARILKTYGKSVNLVNKQDTLLTEKSDQELLDLSKKGVEKRDILNKNGKNETLFLNHLQEVIDNKLTNADHMISKFSKTEDLSELYDK